MNKAKHTRGALSPQIDKYERDPEYIAHGIVLAVGEFLIEKCHWQLPVEHEDELAKREIVPLLKTMIERREAEAREALRAAQKQISEVLDAECCDAVGRRQWTPIEKQLRAALAGLEADHA